MTYKHGNWYCKPASEAEARELVERAVASGAVLMEKIGDVQMGNQIYRWDLCSAWDIYSGRTYTSDPENDTDVLNGATEYTIKQVRELFPLPGEQQQWNGEGFPPVGVDCEFRKNPNEWINGTIFGHRHCNNGDIEVFIDLINSFDYSSNLSRFRPISSEREKWCESASRGLSGDMEMLKHADYIILQIYDAIKSGELKLPEVK